MRTGRSVSVVPDSDLPEIAMSQNAVVNLGWTDIQLLHPVCIGYTIYAESVCAGKRKSSSRPSVGIITVILRGQNQDGTSSSRGLAPS
jgi:itaconyl-CoA hydratase